MKLQLNTTQKEISSVQHLLMHFEDYIAWLDANPLKGNGVFVSDTGNVERPMVPNCGSATGFAIYLGRSTQQLLDLRNQYPEAFSHCIEHLRKRLFDKAVAKDFARLVADKPLLDLRVNNTPT